jgi:hypothetical protein
MGLLLRNAHVVQDVQNSFAFYFKLSGQIIDSNFHPLRNCLQVVLLRDHNDLTSFNVTPSFPDESTAREISLRWFLF